MKHGTKTIARLLALTALAAAWASPPALAQQDAEDINAIIRALDMDEAAGQLTIRAPRTITIRIGNEERTIVIDEGRSIELTVFFEYNSARLTEDGRKALDRLGAALASEELMPQRFLIAGHTDAKGSREYNRQLSLRRAQAVKIYLAENWGIDPDRLEVYGWGEERLKDPEHPFAAINRRVEVVAILPPKVVKQLGQKTRVDVNGRTVVETTGPVKVDIQVQSSSRGAQPGGDAQGQPAEKSKGCPGAEIADPRPPVQPIDDFGGRRTPVPCPSTSNPPMRIKLNK